MPSNLFTSLGASGRLAVLFLALPLTYLSSVARADDTTSDAPAAAPSDATTAPGAESEEAKNKRAATLEGSKSPVSLQLQFAYTGSSIDHPFSKEAANPTHQVPPPAVDITGTLSARYRFDDKTTAGAGVGFISYTPLQGQQHSSINEPYTDIAHSFTAGPIHSRLDFQYTYFTSHQYRHEYGYTQEFSVSNEAFIETSFGLSYGLFLEYDANTFGSALDKVPADLAANQTVYDLQTDPYFEFAINDTFNLRTVIGIIHNQNRNLGPGVFQVPDVYQTFGLGIAVSKPVFLYVYVQADPYSGKAMTSANTTFGCSAIINIL